MRYQSKESSSCYVTLSRYILEKEVLLGIEKGYNVRIKSSTYQKDRLILNMNTTNKITL